MENEKVNQSDDNFGANLRYFLNHRELRKVTSVFIFNFKWKHLIEAVITISVSTVLIIILILLCNWALINGSSFEIMFGTVFGYLLSWRFGK